MKLPTNASMPAGLLCSGISCGYDSGMETVTYRSIQITNIRQPKLLRLIPINFIADRFGEDGMGNVFVPSIAKAQAFIDRSIELGATIENGALVATHTIIDTTLFGCSTRGIDGYLATMKKAGK